MAIYKNGVCKLKDNEIRVVIWVRKPLFENDVIKNISPLNGLPPTGKPCIIHNELTKRAYLGIVKKINTSSFDIMIVKLPEKENETNGNEREGI